MDRTLLCAGIALISVGFATFINSLFQKLTVLMKIAPPNSTFANAEILGIISILAILAGSVTLAYAFPKKPG